MRPTNTLLPCGLVCAVAFLAAEPLRQIPSQSLPVFRAGIDVVQLDVSVLDKDRQPVHGLRAEDLIVREDGKPQTIEHFEEIVVPDAVPPTASWIARISPDVVTNELQDSRLWVIVLDDAMCLNEPFSVKMSKDIARRTIDRMGANDLAAVVFTRDNRNTQDFTSDHAKLNAAVDTFTAGFIFAAPRLHGGGGGEQGPYSDQYFYQSSVRTVKNAADYLIAIPQRRKALVYISIGLPIDYVAATNMTLGSGGDVARRELIVTLQEQMKTALQVAQRANVAIYAFDPAGLNGVGNYINIRGGLLVSPALAPAYREYLQTVADNTGGRAFIDTNTFGPGVEQMFRENGSYYLIGYRQTSPKRAGDYSRLEVKTNRPGLEVRARHVNYTPVTETTKATARGLPPAPAELTSLASLLPDRNAPLRATVAPFATPGMPGGIAVIVLGMREPSPSARVTEHINLVTKAFTPEGDARGSQAQVAEFTITPGPSDVRYEVLSEMALPKPGRYQLRLATSSAVQQRTGSVFIDVVVPDFANEPVSLSGVVIDSTSAPTSLRRDAVNGLLPVVPTAQREFEPTARASAFLRVHQSSKNTPEPATVAVTITDGRDAVVFSASEDLPASRFSRDQSADFRFDLPLPSLKPGTHLLTFVATMGKATARRDVVFEVK